jgi:hypothetical protein
LKLQGSPNASEGQEETVFALNFGSPEALAIEAIILIETVLQGYRFLKHRENAGSPRGRRKWQFALVSISFQEDTGAPSPPASEPRI